MSNEIVAYICKENHDYPHTAVDRVEALKI